jgi:hypothetical protein
LRTGNRGFQWARIIIRDEYGEKREARRLKHFKVTLDDGLCRGRFARAEPRARVRAHVSGQAAALERKNGWTLAEQAGELGPDGMQRLLRRAWSGTWTASAMTSGVTGSRWSA